MPLINCKIDLLLNLCAQWVISFNIGINQTCNYWYKITENYWQLSDSYWYKSKCAITNTKLYVPIVNLSTQDIYKAITTIKIRFQKKKQEKISIKKRKTSSKPVLDYLIDPSFQCVNKLLRLSSIDTANRTKS